MTPLTPNSLDITSEHLALLKALFPNVFTEGKIDFDALKVELGEYLSRFLHGNRRVGHE